MIFLSWKCDGGGGGGGGGEEEKQTLLKNKLHEY